MLMEDGPKINHVARKAASSALQLRAVARRTPNLNKDGKYGCPFREEITRCFDYNLCFVCFLC